MAETVTILGKEYEVAPFDSKMVRDFEKWVRSEAWREIQEMKNEMPADDYKVALNCIAEKMSGKYFRIGGEGFSEAEKSIEGKYRKLWLMVSAKHPELTWEMVVEWREKDFTDTMAKNVLSLKNGK